MRRIRAVAHLATLVLAATTAGCAAIDTASGDDGAATSVPATSTPTTAGDPSATTAAAAPPTQSEATTTTTAAATVVTAGEPTTSSIPTSGVDAVRTALFPIVSAMPGGSCAMVTRGGQVVLDVRSDDTFPPASNEKVLTAATALSVFGPNHRFVTEARARAGIDADGVLRGDLWLVGGGDRFLSTFGTPPAWAGSPEPTLLDTIADQLRDAGLTRITGTVLGDDSRYDRSRVVPTWPDRYRNRDVVFPLSALMVDSEGEFDGSRQPPAIAAEKLVRLLRDRGIAVEAGSADAVARGNAAPGDAVPIAQVSSAPMSEIVGEMLRESDNTTAELVVREIGKKLYGVNTSGGGSRGLQETIASYGIADAGFDAVDGSGLDAGNRLSCRTLVQVLDRYGPASPLAAGMSIAGRTGTLGERFAGSPATDRFVGKTGVIANATSLSGFVTSPDGTVSTFALMVTGESEAASVARWRSFVETLAAVGNDGQVLELG
jgi:serine-type D-Ala-D-Ala carboxypeptidase/endopeptidase (penicillin-binding protein 4)